MVFTDAKTVTINNKEVQSIKTSNDGIIYEGIIDITKLPFYIQSDKSHVELNGERAIITATYNGDGVDIANKIVEFYIGAKSTTPIVPTSGDGEYIQLPNYCMFGLTNSSVVGINNIISIRFNHKMNQRPPAQINFNLSNKFISFEVYETTSSSRTIILYNNVGYINNGYLIYYDENNVVQSYDLTEYDMNYYRASGQSNIGVIYDNVQAELTDENGQCSIEFIPPATGVRLTVVGECMGLISRCNIDVGTQS